MVGVLEDWEMSLAVLEAYLPRYFAGSRRIMAENESLRVVNKNIYKPKVSREVRDYLAAKLSKEIEFYNLCRERLRRQYEALKL